jgi:membrane carboxypeptidase/penicillin-binding protein
MIDAQLSKDQVLELYLNRIYLSGGLYGVETMSRHLFGKPAKQLTLAESALIAGLARAPAALSPWNHLDDAVARSHVVLGRMRDEGFITADQEQGAKRARIRVRSYPGATEAQAGYAKDYLRQLFRDHFGGDHPPEWEVRTTFVPDLQEMAERSVSEGLRRFNDPDLQAALVAMDPTTGDILAMVGGRDFRLSQFNRASRSRRQPGSAFKPLLYAAALEHGFSPVSVLSDLGHVPPQGPDEWSPRNAEADAPDELTLRAALLESDNRAATMLQQRIGSRPVLRLASDVGLRDMPDVPSLSLGTGLVTPLELTAAFAVFPNGGLAVQPRGIVTVSDADGSAALANPVRTERVISPQTAFQMVSMLGDVIDRGTGSAARGQGVRFPAGGKTGTTNEFKDAWFVGFSSDVVVGVWVGFDQPKPIGREAYGSRYALPIWSDFMRRAARLRVPHEFEEPDGLKEEPICRVSYLKPVEGCPVYNEFFKEGDGVPTRLCPVHQGTVKQRVERAVKGFFSGMGKRILGRIFR